ncbi:MAG: primosomal protein N' [Patescibacteria group bacterium]|nr:primosomal protein N' [Patescibacteria group bacterium]
MNYYEVAPLTYLGRETDLLTYSSDQNILTGQAVIIPLRTKNFVGITLEKTTKPSFKTKEIKKIIFDKPVISKTLLETAFWMSEYYCSPITSVLQTIIPVGLGKTRRILDDERSVPSPDFQPKLTPEQVQIVSDITQDTSDSPHLIFGVTGSGKTEIYMRLIEDTLKAGKEAIILVPEVSLTPQALDRYQARFGKRVTLLHSYLKETERFANWQSILSGEKSVIIGSRSALFAPVCNLGLVIIDEEHETSYKQDQAPRYQTVKVAEILASFSKARLILGSATPSIGSYYKTQTASYKLHTLNKRVIQDTLPEVQVVDMRNEFKYGNKSIFSEKLQGAIKKTLADNQQVLLFINRRGMSTFVNCRDCGYVATCPNCNLSLTFHYNSLRLVCHHCGYQEVVPTLCPACQSPSIKYFGTGTQRVEQELRKIVGNKYIIERMDKDTTKKRGSHEDLYNRFAKHQTDVLIGTQMITKGWDFDNLGLVGIISADTMINFPDYNASERTFDLLTQVAGRTGRGKFPGLVV